ncbi:MAG: alpha/beta hydrolase [Planctomycetales bacterium]|nr:alpha/beta hydrolase [Planctomycetales bacterium]
MAANETTRNHGTRGAGIRTLATVATALAGGCSSAAWALPSEREIPELAARLSVAMPGSTGTPEPVSGVAIEERGSGRAKRTIVMVHGVLSDRRVWRFVAGDLGRDHDLVLVDLPGCGESAKPSPAEVGEGFYSPATLAATVLAALEERFESRGFPDRVTFLGHSLGGTVVLRMLADPALRARHARILSRVDGAVLLAPADIAVEKKYPVFEQIVKLSDIEAEIGEATGILAREVLKATFEGATDPTRMPREEAERLSGILGDSARRHAAQAMLRRAIPFRENEHPDWDAIALVESQYRNVSVPCLLVWGRRDETLPVSMGWKLMGQLPRATLRVIPSATHALAVEHPALVSELTRRFVESRGCEGWAPVAELSGCTPAMAATGSLVGR